MTKEEIGDIVKRYPHIAQAIFEKKGHAVFTISKRKYLISISHDVEIVCQAIRDIYYHEKDIWVKKMIAGILSGTSDIALIHKLPWERNAYYERKRKFFEKVYNCCVYFQLITYDEILDEEIK